MKNDNQLIAEFMGWVHSVKNHHGINLFHFPDGDKIPIHCKQQSLEGFQYHSSWDWLMPVVEKIESLGVTVRIDGLFCTIHQIGDLNKLEFTYRTPKVYNSKIEAVYKAVIEFINWHNGNNKL